MELKTFLNLIFLNFLVLCESQSVREDQHNPTRVLAKFFNQCAEKEELIKCLKIQALKVADRALNLKSFNVASGISIVGSNRLGKSVSVLALNESKLEKLTQDELNGLLGDRTSRFLDTHKIELNIPQLVQESARGFTEEGRKKKHHGGKGGHGYGAMFAALAIKGSFLAMAYQGIAVMAGTALLVGKMALILTAILGLKKLVSGNHEKTTFEIIKTPKHTEEHIHSSTYEDDHHEHYKRNYLDTPEAVQRRVYRFQLPEYRRK